MMTAQKKIQALEVEARARLQHPETIVPYRDGDAGVATRLLIWEAPSSKPERSWGLLEVGPHANRSLLLVHQVWHRAADHERAHNPLQRFAFMSEPALNPALAICFVEVGPALGRAWLNAVRDTGLPTLEVSGPYGIDGTTHGFALDWPEVRVAWWCDGPPEWAAMTKVISETRCAMSEELANRPMKADGRRGPAAAYR